MLLNKGVVLGGVVFVARIEADPSKIEVLSQLQVPKTKKKAISFLGFVGYYRQLIKSFTKNSTPSLKFLSKGVAFLWNDC